MAGVLEQLAETILPTVFAALDTAGVVDRMDILTATTSTDSAGGQIQGAYTAAYEDVPVSYDPIETEYKGTKGEKMTSVQQYKLTFPMYDTAGLRIAVNTTMHRLKVLARGNEPAKTFRIIAIRDAQAVYEAICEKED